MAGSTVRGVHGGGRPLTARTPKWGSGSRVAVCLDFDRAEASWLLDLDSPTGAQHAYTLHTLPPGTLYPAIVLDAADDTIAFDPSLPADSRARGEALLCAHRAARPAVAVEDTT